MHWLQTQQVRIPISFSNRIIGKSVKDIQNSDLLWKDILSPLLFLVFIYNPSGFFLINTNIKISYFC